MTKLLDQAFQSLSRMPPEAQDDIARFLLSMTEETEAEGDIEPEHLAAVMEGLDQAKRGIFSPLTPDEALAAAFNRTKR